MKVRLTEKDIDVLMFLGQYKMMLGSDCKKIYDAKDYGRKRLKVLEQEQYIMRVNRLYIKLNDKGTRLVKEFGYDYHFTCRKKKYIERLHTVAKIAGITIGSTINFIASWNMKDKGEYTQIGRKYIGKITFQSKNRIVYYISRNNKITYIKQVINDIQKIIECENVIIFMENMNILKDSKSFVFGKESTMVINPSAKNLDIMRKLENIENYSLLKQIYIDEEILLSDWKKAIYMKEDGTYIVIMPFIDTEKLHSINVFYNSNKNQNKTIELLTLKENKDKINEILIKDTKIIEIDSWLGGADVKE